LNSLLSIDRKYILYFSLIFLIGFLFFIFYKYLNSADEKSLVLNNIISNVDITEPKFAINNSKSKILVTAREGNFLNKDEILLNKNVLFKSKNFVIETDNVIFDRNKQTATSKTKSIFKSEKTQISSDGFDIYDSGNKIKFFGNAIIILKWDFY